MIESVTIKNVATFDNAGVVINNLKKVNLIYGTNGSGKTTISNILDFPDSFTDKACIVSWKNNIPLKVISYNKQFREQHFNKGKIPGVFTLGSATKEQLDKIEILKGEITSTYNADNKSIPVKVTIKHHFFNVQIRVETNESRSISTCGSFDIDEDRGLKQLIYSYQNNPKATVRDRSEIHYGTTRLEISDDTKILEGEYWTSRKTTGDIKLTKEKK